MRPTWRRRLSTLLGLIIVVYLSTVLWGIVQKNYRLKQQINELEVQVEKLDAANEELGYRIQYYKTDAYKEKEARAKLGLQLPGEGVIILPKTLETAEEAAKKQKAAKPKSNFQQWVDFLVGRS